MREFLQVTPGPFPDFWVGPGDEATVIAAVQVPEHGDNLICSFAKELLPTNEYPFLTFGSTFCVGSK